MQIVTRNAITKAGTARRSAGSAVKSRRYAGLAIDCASPLIESDRIDALAASARAIAGLRSERPHLRPEGCAASLRITFIGIEKRGLVESPGEKIWAPARPARLCVPRPLPRG